MGKIMLNGVEYGKDANGNSGPINLISGDVDEDHYSTSIKANNINTGYYSYDGFERSTSISEQAIIQKDTEEGIKTEYSAQRVRIDYTLNNGTVRRAQLNPHEGLIVKHGDNATITASTDLTSPPFNEPFAKISLDTPGDSQYVYLQNKKNSNEILVTNKNAGIIKITPSASSSVTAFRFSTSDFSPYGSGGKIDLGDSGSRWKNVYATNGVIQTSDLKEKENVEDLPDELVKAFVMAMRPSSYTMKDGTSGRTHFGFISQFVEAALKDLGMSSEDFAGFVKTPKEITEEDGTKKIVDGEYTYALRYDEFIAPMLKMIQIQQKEIEELKEALNKITH